MTGLETTLLGAAAKESVGPAKAFISRWGMAKYERLIAEYSNCFEEHIKASANRCSTIKNILYKDERVQLRSQYTNILFKHGLQNVKDDNVLDFRADRSRIIISGTAGAGKTMFMKWLTLNAIDSILHHQRIPLFVELRYLTKEQEAENFIEFLLLSTSKEENRVSIERFKLGLQLGQFMIVLDAIDEVDKKYRSLVIAQIQKFARDYPDCIIVISTRPDEAVESLQDFKTFRSLPMTKDQALDVLIKLRYDETVKSRLIGELESGLFEKHKEFLSNPLLITIMLLTYDQSANIPTKLTAFYKQAFETLYQRHDAAKGAYRRAHYAGLPIDEYERIFSVFCYDTYVDSRSQFSDIELSEYFNVAKEHTRSTASTDDIISDAMKSICVIQRDGLFNTFVHRSFQEYFTALFLSRYIDEDFAELVDGLVVGSVSENVLRMLIELSPDLTEERWVEPRVGAVIRKIASHDSTTLKGCTAIFKALFSSIEVNTETGEVVGYGTTYNGQVGQAGNWLSKLERAYSPRKKIISSLFFEGTSESVFQNLSSYVSDIKLPLNEAESIIERIENHLDEEEDRQDYLIAILPSDLKWLMSSGLPKILGKIQYDCVSYYNEIKERINHRKNSMQQLSRRKGKMPM